MFGNKKKENKKVKAEAVNPKVEELTKDVTLRETTFAVSGYGMGYEKGCKDATKASIAGFGFGLLAVHAGILLGEKVFVPIAKTICNRKTNVYVHKEETGE